VRLPVAVLTGFLGSGKTTLLNRLLRAPELADTAVLVNEFGEVGLDHWLLERVDAETVLLPSGCVCCTVRAELRDALLDLWERRQRGVLPPFRRVVLETTGLADPAPIAQTLTADPRLRHHYALGRIVTVVDALTGAATLARHAEALHQAAAADLLVLAKTDLAEPTGLAQRLAAINPAAALLDAATGLDQVLTMLQAEAGEHPGLQTALAQAHQHAHGPQGGMRSVCLRADQPLDWAAFALWFTLLLHRHGERILRSKGILHLNGVAQPVVVHGVQHVVHPPSHLDRWPEGRKGSVLVLIGAGLETAAIERSFRAFMGLAGGMAEQGRPA
jgi:G3E family GTPase